MLEVEISADDITVLRDDNRPGRGGSMLTAPIVSENFTRRLTGRPLDRYNSWPVLTLTRDKLHIVARIVRLPCVSPVRVTVALGDIEISLDPDIGNRSFSGTVPVPEDVDLRGRPWQLTTS